MWEITIGSEELNIFAEINFRECYQIKYFVVPNFRELALYTYSYGGVIYSESFLIYFDNNTDDATMKCHKNKLADSGFQPCCRIFDIIFRSLQSNSEIKCKK